MPTEWRLCILMTRGTVGRTDFLSPTKKTDGHGVHSHYRHKEQKSGSNYQDAKGKDVNRIICCLLIFISVSLRINIYLFIYLLVQNSKNLTLKLLKHQHFYYFSPDVRLQEYIVNL